MPPNGQAGSSLDQRPRWLRDFLRFLPLKSQFVLSGNVRDLQLVQVGNGAVAAQPLMQVLSAELRTAGYGAVIAYDPVGGFRNLRLPSDPPAGGYEVLIALGLQPGGDGAAPAGTDLFAQTLKVTTIKPFGSTGEDRDVWLEILGDYDERLRGVFGCQSGLDTPAIAEQLRIASDGFVGRMAALVEEAALLAVDDMLRDIRIRPGVQVTHLESAFDAWALARPERNPFRLNRSQSDAVTGKSGSSVLRDDDADHGQRSGVRGVRRSNARDASFRK